jgi:hypothetical protein
LAGFLTFRFRFPGNGESLKLPDWSPVVHITEDDQEYLFKVGWPEMKKDDVKVTVESGVLAISGEPKLKSSAHILAPFGSSSPRGKPNAPLSVCRPSRNGSTQT